MAAGKGRITVRQVLVHASGVSGLDQPATLSDLYDTQHAAARLAARAPWRNPGTTSGYHLLTYGHLIGDLVRRVDGRALRDFIAQEIVRPLGADFQLGVAPTDLARVADVVAPPPAAPGDLDPAGPAVKTFTGPAFPADDANTAAWRAAEIGAANGHATAHGIAIILSALSRDGAAGQTRPIRPGTSARILDEQTNGTDLVNGLHVRRNLGFAVAYPRTLPWIPTGRVA